MNDNFNLQKQMFNSSCISDYVGCPRVFYYTFIRRLVQKEVKVSMNFWDGFTRIVGGVISKTGKGLNEQRRCF